MTREVVVCGPEDPVTRAAELMAKHHVGALPVLEDTAGRRPVGIITDRDIVVRVVARGGNAGNTRVKEAMTGEVVTCHPTQDIREAIDLMADRQLRRILVVEDGRLAGIIAQADIANHATDREGMARMVEEISQPQPKR